MEDPLNVNPSGRVRLLTTKRQSKSVFISGPTCLPLELRHIGRYTDLKRGGGWGLGGDAVSEAESQHPALSVRLFPARPFMLPCLRTGPSSLLPADSAVQISPADSCKSQTRQQSPA